MSRRIVEATHGGGSALALSREWRIAGACLVLALAVVLVAFGETWSGMASVWWTSETFGHGMVVPALAGWLAWRERARLGALDPEPSWAGVAALGLAAAAWLAADLAGIAVVAQFAVVAMLPALVWALAGGRTVHAFAVPLAFLLFMVPAGEALNPPLMEATADATIWALQATGIPVYREGLHFMLPTGRWSVVEACSGLRYVIAAAMLSTLFAMINFTRPGKRIAFVALALAVSILANWARAYLVVMVGHLSGMRYGVGDDHVVYGWVFFGFVMMTVFWMGARWRDASEPASPIVGATSVSRVRRSSQREGRGFGSPIAIAIGIAALLAATRVGAERLRDVEPRADFEALATAALPRVELAGGPFAMTPTFEGARGRVQFTLDSSTRLEAYAAYFARQEPGREMIAFGNGVVGDGWQPMSHEDRTVDVDGRPLAVREWRLRAGNVERLAWSWYTVGGRETGGNDYRAKAATAWAMLTGRGDHSTVVVVGTDLSALPTAVSAAERYAAIEAARALLARAAAPFRTLSGHLVSR